MKRFLAASLAFSTLVALSAVAEPMDNTTTVVVNPSMTKADVKVKVGQILEVVMVVNNNEIKAGKVALKRASHADVKKFAELMIQDHSQNLQATKNVAETLNILPISSDLSDKLVKKGDKELSKLESVPARRFDKVYMEAMVEDHQKLLNVIDTDLLPNASNPKMIDHLKATREKVAYHLQLAKQIQSKL